MLIVVGGTRRKVGKTSVVCGIVSGLREWGWTAVKITPHSHGHSRPGAMPDSERYVRAGAARSFWIRTPAGEVERALPAMSRILGGSENVIVESNSAVDLLTPDLCLMVVDDDRGDWKASSRRFFDRADAVVLTSGGVEPALTGSRPRFEALPPEYRNMALLDAIRLKNLRIPADTTCR